MPPHNPDIGNQQPCPSHFVLRDTVKGKAKAVPLIAVDELPPSLHITGVPRSFELDEAVGLLNLGVHKESESYYHVTRGEARIQEAKAEKGLLDSIHNPNAKTRITTTRPPPSTAATTTTPKPPPNSPKSSSPPNEPNTSIPRNQQHCHHWCKHGICKWGQGCHYRHIMPMTQVGLHEVGLTDWPSWYQKRNPGLFQSDLTAPPLSKRAARRGAVSESGRVVGSRVVSRKGSGFGNLEEGDLAEIFKMLMREREKGAEMRKEKVDEKEQGVEVREKSVGGVKKGVKGRGAVKAPVAKDVRGLDDRVVKRETGRWEDDESGDESDISSLPTRREVASSESEIEREKKDIKAKEKLVDV